MKLIFVASDFSGLGKGVFSASLGKLLRSQGINARIMKSDLYFNYDAGTINPQEHGEVYVLADGTEVDQDFGIYERFLGVESSKKDYVTSGRLFHQIYLNEREGKYLGQTVSTEHIIDEYKKLFKEFLESCDVGIIELGATVGDLKGQYVLETVRQLSKESIFILLSYMPFLKCVGELKTMGAQRSVQTLRAKGIKPDLLILRTEEVRFIPEYNISKLELYCETGKDSVYVLPDVTSEYVIPDYLVEQSFHKKIFSLLNIDFKNIPIQKCFLRKDTKKNVVLLGKYSHDDAYKSIIEQLSFVGVYNISFKEKLLKEDLKEFDAVIIPGGWGSRGTEDIISSVTLLRENNVPTLGICLGLQLMVIEYTRNVLGKSNANSSEFSNECFKIIDIQENQDGVKKGGTARLGNWTTFLKEGSKVSKIFRSNVITQRHRHRYEVQDYDYDDFEITGLDADTNLIEVMELKNHPFFIGVQFHPEFCIGENPLFKALIESVE